MSESNYEPSAMEKFNMQKNSGVVVNKAGCEIHSTAPEIKVTVTINNKYTEYELDTLFLLGIAKDSGRVENGIDVHDVAGIYTGKLDDKHSEAIINVIHDTIERTPPLLGAERKYQIHYLSRHGKELNNED